MLKNTTATKQITTPILLSLPPPYPRIHPFPLTGGALVFQRHAFLHVNLTELA